MSEKNARVCLRLFFLNEKKRLNDNDYIIQMVFVCALLLMRCWASLIIAVAIVSRISKEMA